MGGESEYRLPDGRRVDILTKGLAIEVDWVKKWPEAIGQSIGYAIETDRMPAILLLLRNKPTEQKYLDHAFKACERAGIPCFTWLTVNDLA